MRTTVRIEEELYRQAKADAANRGQTVGQLIEDALRLFLRRTSEPTGEIPPLPVFGGGGTMPGVDLRDRGALSDLMEADRDVDALR